MAPIILDGHTNIISIETNQEMLQSFRVYGGDSQQGLNACGRGEHNCSELCIALPRDRFYCDCPDGLTMNQLGQCFCLISDNREDCTKRALTCSEDEFQCLTDGKCLDR